MGRFLKIAAVVVFAVSFVLLVAGSTDIKGAVLGALLGLTLATAGDVV